MKILPSNNLGQLLYVTELIGVSWIMLGDGNAQNHGVICWQAAFHL